MRMHQVAGLVAALAIGVLVGRLSGSGAPLDDARAPLVTITGACPGVEEWPAAGPFEPPRGEDGRRSAVHFVRHDDRATVDVITDGLGDDSVEADIASYALTWSEERQVWVVSGCQRRVLSCYRGSPPVCS